jgi:hypothetical protein
LQRIGDAADLRAVESRSRDFPLPDEPLDELSDLPDEFGELSLDSPFEALPDAPSELSADVSLDSPSGELGDVSAAAATATVSDAPAEESKPPRPKREPGRFVKSLNIYNVMLLISVAALAIAILLLLLEWWRYGFTVGPPKR